VDEFNLWNERAEWFREAHVPITFLKLSMTDEDIMTVMKASESIGNRMLAMRLISAIKERLRLIVY
jgi:hypothetical protein